MMVMLVILVLGITTVFITSLSGTAMQNKRNQTTADALAKAKEALIGYAVADTNLPGGLPCPDLITNISGSNVPNDGVADLLSSNDCPSYIGHLPWKTLGISDLRDGTGERLWYALSPAFKPQTNPKHLINSETSGNITLSGNASVNNLVAIVFAPGMALSNQSRTTANENSYAHYLESVVTVATSFLQASPNDHAGGAYSYNDQLAVISPEDIHVPIEIRIAREARHCLNAYATAHSNRYPWAADVANAVYPYSQTGVQFGRFPKYAEPSSSSVRNFINSLSDFQAIVNACANGTGNQTTLSSLGGTLKSRADYLMDHQPSSPAMSTSITSPAKSAGDKAADGDVTCSNIQANPTSNSIQTLLNQTVTALSSQTSNIFTWPTSCTLVSASYWPYWQDLVFYQVDNQFRPGGSGGTASIQINGAGTYHAAVAVARNWLSTQPPRYLLSADSYLEGLNVHTATSPAADFETYNPTSSSYTNNNDLVLCLDGNPSGACQ